MSDYLNKRGKILVALALTDSAQQELVSFFLIFVLVQLGFPTKKLMLLTILQNYRSILDAQQQDLFESNIEHVQLDAKRDAESVFLNKSGCTIEVK